MDAVRFDALTRVLGDARGRRSLLCALVGVALGGTVTETVAKKRGQGKAKDRDRDTGRDRNRERDNERGRDAGRDHASDRRSEPRLHAEGGKKRRRKKKKRGGRQDPGGGQPPPPPPDGCCGADTCADPEPGSTSSGCDFAGRNFAGADHNGSLFRGIDGRGAVFTATDNSGSVFAEACLQGASFRRAHLGGSTWKHACLFEADFRGADLGGESAVFAGALFCGTIMPDGTLNNRDCGRATACCRRLAQSENCEFADDCPDGVCVTKSCQDGQCWYTGVIDGPSPNGLCTTHCCEGTAGCCPAGATSCDQLTECCVPSCAGKQCGPDGCGGHDTCGTCAAGQRCTASGQCVCDAQNCPNGCCDTNDTCQPGTTNAACGTGGGRCDACGAGQGCLNQRCAACTPACADKQCGPDGCGRTCGACPEGAGCNEANGLCVTCVPPCQPGQRCNGNRQCVCDAVSCPSGCCDSNGACQPGTTIQVCGTGGASCASCGGQETCQNGQCVGCGPICTCSGQSTCASPDATNVVCSEDSCVCVVSVEGRPFCARSFDVSDSCTSDADCEQLETGAICAAAATVPGTACPGNPFCALPCRG